ncbi:MAG: histidine phosphatase family protein [Myxococcota bacterium]
MLIRHGRIDAERRAKGARRCIGWTDLGLVDVEETRAQMRRHAEALGEVTRVISSDLVRATHTAELLCAQLGIPGYEEDARLRELHFGRWEGKTWPEIEAAQPEEYAQFMANWRTRPTPGGESYAMLRGRVRAFWEDVSAEDAQAAVVIVAHHGSLRALRGVLLGLGDDEAMGQSWSYGDRVRVTVPRPSKET